MHGIFLWDLWLIQQDVKGDHMESPPALVSTETQIYKKLQHSLELNVMKSDHERLSTLFNYFNNGALSENAEKNPSYSMLLPEIVECMGLPCFTMYILSPAHAGVLSIGHCIQNY